jgi:hypothetical protein
LEEQPVPVTVYLHKTHRRYTGGRDAVAVDGSTVGECLKTLVEIHPGLETQLFEGPGRLKKTVEIYLNLQSTYPEELAKATGDGDVLHITLMLAGG